MSWTDCEPSLWFFGPVFMIVGAFVLRLGIEVWRHPDSAFVQRWVRDQYVPESYADPITRFFGMTRERAGPMNLLVWLILGPLIGTVFLCVGLWTLASQIHCGTQFDIARLVSPLFGPLAWTWWPGGYAFAAVCVTIGIVNTWRASWPIKCATVAYMLAFAVCGWQVAGFHTGVYANRWAALGGILVAVGIVASLLWKRFSSSSASNRERTPDSGARRS